MISIQTHNGQLIKNIVNTQNERFGFHRLFGFISEKRATERLAARKRQAFDYSHDEWNFSFKVEDKKGVLSITQLENCQLITQNDDSWTLQSKMGDYKIVKSNQAQVPDLILEPQGELRKGARHLETFLLALLLTSPILYLVFNEPLVEETVEDEVKEVITVKIVKPKNVVTIKQDSPKIKAKPLTKAQKSNIAVKRNLGFLSLAGSKNMKDAVGGVPQKLKAATAGAGKGGDAGSGGELIAGLGKGLKKTTVGNTGVAGLGGIGTKGAGGGAGGYGNSRVASGSGKGISAIAVSNSNVALEGGLSRYAINATIAKYLSQVRRCYETSLKKSPDLNGLVEVSFQINGTGMLNFSKVKRTTLKHAPTEKCITDKMMSWQFPTPKGGVNVAVNYPFMLRPVGR